MKQNIIMQYRTINNYETMSLKSLALLVLERNKNENKIETNNKNHVSLVGNSNNVSYALVEKLKLLSPTQYEQWEERAAIMEYEANMPKNIAEREAYNNVIKVSFGV